MELYRFQEDCVKEIFSLFKKERAICLSWYTGSGKTNIFTEVCVQLLKQDHGVKIGISAYLTNEIRAQVTERCKEFGLKDVTQEITAGSSFNLNKSVFVFNPQGLYRKVPDIKFDLFIIDEAHIAMDEKCIMIRKLMKECCTKKTKILLVSATPWDTLALKEFKDIPVLKRPIDMGLKDGLVTDFKFFAEEALVTFQESDFTRIGDLGASAVQRQMAILKSAVIGKLHHIVKSYDKELGNKVLVICPPGNYTEIPFSLEREFPGLAFTQHNKLHEDGSATLLINSKLALERFKTDPSVRFLFVVNKCSVGFDMPELTSVVDMTMSRNICLLAQRCGRIARKNGKTSKNYFYVYDQSLMRDRLEWLISTMIDFCLGAYDGWTTKKAKYRKVTLANANWQNRHPFSVTLNEVVEALSSEGLITNQRTLSYLSTSPPTRRTLEEAKAQAAKYSSRTEMWEKEAALYKWFRLNAKDVMDQIFPLKINLGKWTEETIVQAMSTCSTRTEFRDKYKGAEHWLKTRIPDAIERDKFKDKHLAKNRSAKRWSDESVRELLSRTRTWAHIRNYAGARKWIYKNGGEVKWKKIWIRMMIGRRKPKGRPKKAG